MIMIIKIIIKHSVYMRKLQTKKKTGWKTTLIQKYQLQKDYTKFKYMYVYINSYIIVIYDRFQHIINIIIYYILISIKYLILF